jgi:hypothetical protein
MSRYNSAGGEWYSHPAAGQCTGDQRIGDGSNCTYRLIETSQTIKASCLYELFDTTVESYNPTCFSGCP